MSERFLLAQISDPHIRADARDDGFDPAANLARVLEHIADMRVDCIIATGDLANDARPDEYARLAELLASAPAPLYLVPGNHDDLARMRSAFPAHAYLADSPAYVIEDYPLRIIAIDDTEPGAVHGAFTPAHADALEAALALAPDAPTIIALHHPPILTGDRVLDTIGLHDSARFSAIVSRFPSIVRVICGHNHRAVTGVLAHAPVFIAPSTAWSFSLALHDDQPVARRADAGRGWALHVFTPETGLVSHVMFF